MAKRIEGITIEIGGDTTKLTDALKKTNKTIGETKSELKDVDKLLKVDPKNPELLRQKYNKVQTEISAVKDKLSQLKVADEQAKKQLESGEMGKDKYEALQREIIETEQLLDQLGRTARNTDTAMGAALKSAGEKAIKAGQKIAPASAVAAAGLVASAKTYSGFDAQMSVVRAKMNLDKSNAEDAEMLRLLEEKAEMLGATTKFTATQVAEAYSYMGMAGWSAQQALDGIDGVLYASAADNIDLGLASDIITDAITAFGLKASDSGWFADLLAQTAAKSNTSIELMGKTFEYVAAPAGAGGIDPRDIAAAVAMLANAGIKGDKAGTQLRSIVSTMLKKQNFVYDANGNQIMTKNADGLTIPLSTGEMAVKTADGKLDFWASIQAVNRAYSAMNDADRLGKALTVFGKVAAPGASILAGASAEELYSAYSFTHNGAYDGSAKRMADVMLDNLQGDLTLLGSALDGVKMSIGKVLDPFLRSAVQFATDIVTEFNKLPPEAVAAITGIGTALAAASPTLIVGGQILKLLGDSVTQFRNLGEAVKGLPDKLSGLKTVIGEVGGVFTAHPVISSLALLAAGLVALYQNYKPFQEWVDGVVRQMKEFVEKEWPKLKEKMTEITDSIKSFFSGVLEKIQSFFTRAPRTAKGTESEDGVHSGSSQDVHDVNAAIAEMLENTPRFASGGRLTRGSAWVGEHAPELLTVSGGVATVTPIGGGSPFSPARVGAGINQTNYFYGYRPQDGTAAVNDLNRKLGRIYRR